MGMGRFEFVCFVIVSILELSWVISEFIAVTGVNDSNDSLVVGHIEDKKRKGYLYFPTVCFVIYGVTRFSTYSIRKDLFDTYVQATIFIASVSVIGIALYEVPVTVLVYLISDCRNNYLMRVQVASRILHSLAVVVRVIFLKIVTIKAIKIKDSKNKYSSCIICLLALLYFAGAASVIGLSSMTLKDHNLVNNYDPHLSETSVMFVPPGMLPSTPLSNFPIGKSMTSRGTTTDHFIVLPSVKALVNSRTVIERTEFDGGTGKNARTIKGHFLTAYLDCKHIPLILRPTRCTELVQFLFRYDTHDNSASVYGRIHFNCGLKARGICNKDCPPLKGGWTLRLIHRTSQNVTSAGDDSVVTTPWQDVVSCGETPVTLDEDMSACRGSSNTVSLLASVLCVLVSMYLRH